MKSEPVVIFPGEESFINPQKAAMRNAHVEEGQGYENLVAPLSNALLPAYGGGNPLQIIQNPATQPVNINYSPTPVTAPQASLPVQQPVNTYQAPSGEPLAPQPLQNLGPATSGGGSAISTNPQPLSNSTAPTPSAPQPTASSSQPTPSTDTNLGYSSSNYPQLGSGLASSPSGMSGAASSPGTPSSGAGGASAAKPTVLEWAKSHWWILAIVAAAGTGFAIYKMRK